MKFQVLRLATYAGVGVNTVVFTKAGKFFNGGKRVYHRASANKNIVFNNRAGPYGYAVGQLGQRGNNRARVNIAAH